MNMATIPGFPQDLIDEHMAWHMNPIGTPGARSATNQGVDFLQFHHNFLNKFFTWFNAKPATFRNQFDVSPWLIIPDELKNDPNTGWNPVLAGQEKQITTNVPPFSSEDTFGSFIETGLHNRYLHGACAIHFNDPNIGSPMTMPIISSYFYQIHGLVNVWWDGWKNRHTNDFVNSHRFAELVRILFGVTNDGPGVVIGPSGPTPIGPWGPFAHLAADKRDALLGLGLTELSHHVNNVSLKAQVHKTGIDLVEQSLSAIRSAGPQSRA